VDAEVIGNKKVHTFLKYREFHKFRQQSRNRFNATVLTTPYFRMVSKWPARTNSIAYDTKTLHMCLIQCNSFTPSATDYVAKRRGQFSLCYLQVTMLLYVNLSRRGKNPQWLMHTYVFKLCAQTNDRGRSD
jgi:hypothetical protein